MNPEDYARIRPLFDQAMDLPVDERRGFVERSLKTGDALRPELLAMVEAGDDATFISKPPLPRLPDGLPGAASDSTFQIDNYKVVRELARGGMGVVYLALRNDDVFSKVVALKVILGSGATHPDFIQRFRQERQILAGLDHPNIARILDGGNTEDGRPFYVMEYIAGSPIDEYASRTTADVATRVRMITDVCDAVEYLHAHAITHRDIKPNNIMVTPEGRIKLVDFGIAKVDTVDGLVASSSTPGQPTMIMTPGYASPEQLHGAPSGKSGDIYSLGVVLYRLLTGRLPYVDENGRPNLAAQLTGADPDAPSKVWKSATNPQIRVPDSENISYPDLDRVVMTALQRDPVKRYGTVQMFAEDLRRCLEGRPIAAVGESSAYRFRKFLSRNRVAAVLAVALVLVSGAGGWLAVSARIERARLEAREEEAERFVALLNARVARWTAQGQEVPVTEKVADVQAANELMTSGAIQTLSADTPDPERVKRLVDDLRGVLDRAEALSSGSPPLRKEIALAYRQIGDFQATAPRVQIADKTEAQASYRRAATVAASVRSAEPSWAQQQLSELGGRLEGLGAPLSAAAEPEPEAPPPTPQAPVSAPPVPAAAPPAAAATPPARVAARPVPKPAAVAPAAIPAQDQKAPPAEAVDTQARAELTQRLRTLTANAENARRNLAALQASLARGGQTIRAELLTSMSRIDGMIEDIRTALASNDLTSAEDGLNRAGYELRKLMQAVGG